MLFKYEYVGEDGRSKNVVVSFAEVAFPGNCQYRILKYVEVSGNVLQKDKDAVLERFMYDFSKSRKLKKRIVVTGKKRELDTYKFIKVNKIQVGDETSPAGSADRVKTGVAMGMFQPKTDKLREPKVNRKTMKNLKFVREAMSW